MMFVKAIVSLIILVCVVFFLLGLKSQKGEAPGLVNGQLAPLSSRPNAVSSETGTQPERQVQPLHGDLNAIIKALKATGGTITSQSESYISATYMSSVFKFVDDVELRLDTSGVWHIRLASRVGYSDRNVNRERVEKIRAAL